MCLISGRDDVPLPVTSHTNQFTICLSMTFNLCQFDFSKEGLARIELLGARHWILFANLFGLLKVCVISSKQWNVSSALKSYVSPA